MRKVKPDGFGEKISKDEFLKNQNYIKRFVELSIKGHIDYLDESNYELIELVKILSSYGYTFDRINIFFLVNGVCNYTADMYELKKVKVFTQTWDIERFFKLDQSNSQREPIEISLITKSEYNLINGLQCIKIPILNELYECFLVVIPGVVLYHLYNEYSSELLESNVRAFLGQNGKYNKGIRDTIRQNPEMFLPYNNGITATADFVETVIVNGQLYITKLKDFQIVNGGQTTASIYHTAKKFKDADLSKVFVQMKLTVIKDEEIKNKEVPNIANFANRQNKVSDLDLSSNNPFFRQVEVLSRKKFVTNPINKSQLYQWYFERVAGQYKESLNKLTPAKQNQFKETHPINLKFDKGDLAKYINIWQQFPHIVSGGKQKNFIEFTKQIEKSVSKGKLPGENFYKKLIANGILFKAVDKLYGKKGDSIGDTNIKSFIVTYTLSYFHYLTNNRLDLWKIYLDQVVSDAVLIEIRKLLYKVYDELMRKSNGNLFSEVAKKESTWNDLKKMTYDLDHLSLNSFLVTNEEKEEREIEKISQDDKVSIQLEKLTKIHSISIEFWQKLRDDLVSGKEIADVKITDVITIHHNLKQEKNFDAKEIELALKILELVSEKFPNRLVDVEVIDYLKFQFIYDKFKEISSETWSKIFDLNASLKILENQELLNLKSVKSVVDNGELIKDRAFLKSYISLRKMSRFGIKIF
jgi:hypothetical protein